jgi:hypothetical protein
MADSASTAQQIENRYISPNFFHLEALKNGRDNEKEL